MKHKYTTFDYVVDEIKDITPIGSEFLVRRNPNIFSQNLTTILELRYSNELECRDLSRR
jgi:hypothetical protein